ncbi:MAG: Hsp20/alpha crystallin family protein [Terriglobia bacterium]
MKAIVKRWEPFGELARWDPFCDLAALEERMERLFGLRGEFGEARERGAWLPAVDIVEDDNQIVLQADLPGVDPKGVDIQVENGTLMLRGERKYEKEVKEEDYRRVERAYGSFVRRFALPKTVDADKIQAEYRDGVLELRLPKRAEAKPKQIKVAVK